VLKKNKSLDLLDKVLGKDDTQFNVDKAVNSTLNWVSSLPKKK